MPVQPPTSLIVSSTQFKLGRHWERLTEVLILVKISLHRAEQARCRRVTWYRLISVMAFFHSADVKGIDGRETGSWWDCRFMAFARIGGLDSLITGASLALRLCFGEMGGETEFLLDLALLLIVRDPKFAESGLERTSGISPLGMASIDRTTFVLRKPLLTSSLKEYARLRLRKAEQQKNESGPGSGTYEKVNRGVSRYEK